MQLFPLSRHNLFWHRQKARRLVRVQAPDPQQALALLPEPAVQLGPVRLVQVQVLQVQVQVQVQVLPVLQQQVLRALLQQVLRALLLLPLLP